jgi:hypothetical protein
VAGKTHQWCLRAAARPQIVDTVGADLFAPEAKRAQDIDQEIEATGIFRRYRATRDQFLRQIQRSDFGDFHRIGFPVEVMPSSLKF